MNDELNKEDSSESLEDEPASLRVENEVNDDATVDSSSVDVAVCKKKNNLPVNYGIVSAILILSSIVTFFVSEIFTNSPGKFVSIKDTVRGFKGILDGEYDDLPEQAFLMVGKIEEVVEKAKTL